MLLKERQQQVQLHLSSKESSIRVRSCRVKGRLLPLRLLLLLLLLLLVVRLHDLLPRQILLRSSIGLRGHWRRNTRSCHTVDSLDTNVVTHGRCFCDLLRRWTDNAIACIDSSAAVPARRQVYWDCDPRWHIVACPIWQQVNLSVFEQQFFWPSTYPRNLDRVLKLDAWNSAGRVLHDVEV